MLQREEAQKLPAVIRGGYGRDRSWQMQQLEALQAERDRYLAHHDDNLSIDHMESSEVDTGPTGASLAELGLGYGERRGQSGPGYYMIDSQSHQDEHGWPPETHSHRGSTSFGNHSDFQSHQTMQDQQQQRQQQRTDFPDTSAHSASAPNLAMLGAHFPSSHSFPAARQHHSSQYNSNVRHEETGKPSLIKMEIDEEGQETPVKRRERNFQEGSSRGRHPGSSNPATQESLNENGERSADERRKGKATGSSSSSSHHAALMDPDAPYTFEPAPRPPPRDVDVSLAQRKIPEHFGEAFFSPGMSRLQPHLTILREEQLKRKDQGLSANIRRGERKPAGQQGRSGGAEGSPDEMGGDERKKPAHVLLTEAEKKANHIASEQKRRANIRKGYEMLCELVPNLNEAAGGGNEESEDDMDEEEDDGDKKRKRRASKNDGGCDIGGEKIDGRAGPRSEAVILMKCK